MKSLRFLCRLLTASPLCFPFAAMAASVNSPVCSVSMSSQLSSDLFNISGHKYKPDSSIGQVTLTYKINCPNNDKHIISIEKSNVDSKKNNTLFADSNHNFLLKLKNSDNDNNGITTINSTNGYVIAVSRQHSTVVNTFDIELNHSASELGNGSYGLKTIHLLPSPYEQASIKIKNTAPTCHVELTSSQNISFGKNIAYNNIRSAPSQTITFTSYCSWGGILDISPHLSFTTANKVVDKSTIVANIKGRPSYVGVKITPNFKLDSSIWFSHVISKSNFTINGNHKYVPDSSFWHKIFSGTHSYDMTAQLVPVPEYIHNRFGTFHADLTITATSY